MGRPRRVSDEVIESVIEEVKEAGSEPTVTKVRERLGGIGSFTTIARVLEKWRSEHPAPEAKDLKRPESVERAFAALWSEAWRQASRQVAEAYQAERERDQNERAGVPIATEKRTTIFSGTVVQ